MASTFVIFTTASFEDEIPLTILERCWNCVSPLFLQLVAPLLTNKKFPILKLETT